MMFLVSFVYAVLVAVVLSAPSHDNESSPGSRGHGLDSLAFHRLARPDNSRPPSSVDFSGGDVIRSLLTARGLDHMGGGEAIRVLDPFSGGLMLRSLDRLSGGGFLDSLDHYKAGEVIVILDRLTGGDLLRSLDSSEGTAVLEALEMARRRHPMVAPKRRTLDSLSGMAFGTSKRFDTLSGVSLGVSKRNFDEIDNVGFNGFAKRAPGGGWRQLALAKKRNFDEIDRVGFGDYSKRNFDEIDRTGFEGFLKRKEGE